MSLVRLLDREELRAKLDELNEDGKHPILVGMDDGGYPFLITLVGPYAEGELVLFDSPWQSDIDWATGRTHCDECLGHEHGIEDLRFPVTVMVGAAL